MDNTEHTTQQSLHAASRIIKAQARRSLKGHHAVAVGATVLYVLMTSTIAVIALLDLPGQGLVSTILGYVLMFLCDIVLGVLEFGLVSIFMKLQYHQTPTLADLFAGFRESTVQIIEIKAFMTVVIFLAQLPLDLFATYATAETDLGFAILIGVMCTLCALYLIFLFWFSLAYALCWYILLDYPGMNWREVMHRSRMLMDGNKRVLFYLDLSLMPLFLLSLLTLGIASFWVSAYQSAIEAAFYCGLINSRQNRTSQES